MIEFTVFGTPAPGGSKRGFPIRGKGGKIGVRLIDDSKRGKPWQAAVRAEAAEVMHRALTGRLLDAPLEVHCTFFVRRPKGDFRRDGSLKPSARRWPAVKPDAGKLWRAVADALTGVVWRDDSLVVVEHVVKRYGEPERVELRIAAAPQPVMETRQLEQPQLAIVSGRIGQP